MHGIRVILSGMILLILAGTARSQPAVDGEKPNPDMPACELDDVSVLAPVSETSYFDSEAVSGSRDNLCPAATSCPAGAFEAGASFYLLKPHFQNNAAFMVSTGSTTVSGSNTTTTGLASTTSFDWNYQPAAAFWLGYRSESGLGVRAGYFFFDQSSGDAAVSETGAQASAGQVISPSPFTPTNFPNIGAPVAGRFNFGSPGFLLNGPGVPPTPIGQDNLLFSSSLRINAVDVEATYALQTGSWSFVASAGGRYLRLSQRYHGVLTNSGGGTGDSEIQTLDFYHQFTGGGPTIAGLASWRLPQTNLGFFGRGRGSLLVGSTNQNVAFTQTVNDPAGLAGAPGSFSFASAIPSTSDSVMPVTELELGLEYSWFLWNSVWTGRASVINQTYFEAGNASSTTGNLSLFGCQLGLGVCY